MVFNVFNKSIYNLLGENTDAPVLRRRFEMVRKGGRSTCNFVKDASLLLLSNLCSNFDSIEFEIYNGKRRSLHLTKLCYSPFNYRTLETFSPHCFDQFYLHSLKQFYKAKEFCGDMKFRFQLKFGDLYFTSVPSNLIEESLSVPYYKLQEALKKGYKQYNFSLHQAKEASDDSEEDENDGDIFKVPEEPSKPNKPDNQADPKKKKKKKKNKNMKTFSAFDSNINSDDNFLYGIFEKNEFDSKTDNNYIAYVEMSSVKLKKLNAYRLNYNSDLELVRVETLPIKWLSIDIRNLCHKMNKKSSRDLRFSLISEKEIKFGSASDEEEKELFSNKNVLNQIIKDCIFKKNGDSGNNLILCEEFKTGEIFIRHSKAIKYQGGFDNWKPIFDLAKIDIPEDFARKWLEFITVSISDSDEFSDNDEYGKFQIFTNR